MRLQRLDSAFLPTWLRESGPTSPSSVIANTSSPWISCGAIPTTPGTGILVARIAGSAAFVNQLIETLNDNLGKYTKKVLPKEIYDDGEQDQGSGEGV
jgi:hypothetical protein